MKLLITRPVFTLTSLSVLEIQTLSHLTHFGDRYEANSSMSRAKMGSSHFYCHMMGLIIQDNKQSKTLVSVSVIHRTPRDSSVVFSPRLV